MLESVSIPAFSIAVAICGSSFALAEIGFFVHPLVVLALLVATFVCASARHPAVHAVGFVGGISAIGSALDDLRHASTNGVATWLVAWIVAGATCAAVAMSALLRQQRLRRQLGSDD